MKKLLLATMILGGCASQIKAPWAESLKGNQVFLIEAPSFMAEKSGRRVSLDRCGKFTIEEIWTNKIVLGQGGNSFISEFENLIGKDSSLIEDQTKRVLGENWPFKELKKTIKGNTYTTKELLCKGVVWTGMSKTELMFLVGRPSSINRTVNSRLTREQWVYGDGAGKTKYYYFENEILTSWQD